MNMDGKTPDWQSNIGLMLTQIASAENPQTKNPLLEGIFDVHLDGNETGLSEVRSLINDHVKGGSGENAWRSLSGADTFSGEYTTT